GSGHALAEDGGALGGDHLVRPADFIVEDDPVADPGYGILAVSLHPASDKAVGIGIDVGITDEHVAGDSAVDIKKSVDLARREDAGDRGTGEKNLLDAVGLAGRAGEARLLGDIKDASFGRVDVGGVDGKDAAAISLFGDAADGLGIESGFDVAFEAGNVGIGCSAPQEREDVPWLDPVLLGIAIEVEDFIDGSVIAEEGERRDERAGADAGDDIELRARHVTSVDGTPAFQKPGAERAPVATTGNDEHVSG